MEYHTPSSMKGGDGRLLFRRLSQIAKLVLVIPHLNAGEERVFQWCEKTRLPFAQTLGSTKHCQACLLSNWQLMSLATNMNPRTHCKARKVTWVYNKEHRKS